MDLLFLISNLTAACLLVFFGAILLLVKPHEYASARYYRRAKYWLSFGIIVAGISIFVALGVGKFTDSQIEVLNIYSLLFIFLVSISGMLAFTHLYNSQKLRRRTLVWVFAPAAVLLALYLAIEIVWGSPKVYSLDELMGQLAWSPGLIVRVLILFAIAGAIFQTGFRYFQARRAYRAMLEGYFSDDEELRRSRWIDWFFWCLLLLLLAAVVACLISSPWYDLFYTLLLMCCMVFLVVRFINYQNRFMRIIPAVELFRSFAPQNRIPTMTCDPVADKLLQQWVMQPGKFYLMPGITLGDLSRMTGLGKHRLSGHLNAEIGMSFNAWITSLRIGEVERQLVNWQCIKTLSEIAFDTGFSDLAAMSNAFKKAKKIAPSAYRRQSAAQTDK